MHGDCDGGDEQLRLRHDGLCKKVDLHSSALVEIHKCSDSACFLDEGALEFDPDGRGEPHYPDWLS